MKYPSFIFILILFAACNSKNNTTIEADSLAGAKLNAGSKITVDDPALFPKGFLDSLRSVNYPDSIHLTKTHIIVGKNPTLFPDVLKKGQVYNFTAKKDALQYLLNAKRVNLTDIDFEYIVKLKDSVLYKEKGISRLQPLFFLGTEHTYDDNGIMYSAHEYFNIKKSSIYSINISEDRDRENLLRAYIKGDQKNSSSKITLRTP